MRSLLLVRADDAGGLEVAKTAGADAVVIELPEDADPDVAGAVRRFLQTLALEENRPLLFVRLGSIAGAGLDGQLAAIMPGEPDGIFLGRCRGGQDVQHLGTKLAVKEAELDFVDGQTAIVAEVGSAARTLLTLDSFCDASPRLMALAWNPRDFAADMGLEPSADAPEPGPLITARSLVLIAARAAEVSAIDVSFEGESEDALRGACEQARRDGFNAKLAVSPGQIAVIGAVFDRAG